MVKRKKSTSLPKTVENFESQIQEIMECFDFEIVLEYMNWDRSRRIYGGTDRGPWKVLIRNSYKVPSIIELKELAESQLREVVDRYNASNESFYSIHCGPFKSTCSYGVLTLECIIADWRND